MENKSSSGIGAKAIIAIVFLVLFTIFVLQNTDIVEINFFFWHVTISRVLVLLLSLAVGCIVGVFIGWEMFGRKKKQQP
jgi:uncharacterized integral membrane protein